MAKTAILFTGQGAQSPGMGRDFAEAFPASAEIYAEANEQLSYDLRGLCFDGPADRLEQTDIQQPAIFVTSVAIWRAMNADRDLLPATSVMAGLSLGEYAALYAAGSMSFADALRLVARRGQLMQQAAVASPSGMVSVLGLDEPAVQKVCQEAAGTGILVPANFNCPGQIVISGARSACESAVPLIEAAGGRAIPLKVAGAFHSPFMQPAADGLRQVLNETDFSAPKVPVIANVNVQPHGQADTIRQWLTDQLTHPVRWQATMERMIADGIERFIEVGPGRVLTGLMRKIARRANIVNVSTVEGLKELDSI